MGCIGFTFAGSYVFVGFFLFGILKYMRESSHLMSDKTKKMNRRLTMALVCQVNCVDLETHRLLFHC